MNNNPKQKKSSFQLAPVCAAVLLAFGVQTAQANPVGAAVVNGQASFASSANTLTVTNTPGTIINWQGFSIQQNEITRFAQQSASSTVLNRVVTNNPSQILGTLQSNGRVFLVNPNGIIFGAGSTVDVAGLVATTLNLSNADFLAGRHNFTQVPGAANISNAGNLTAQSGGEIYLIAPNVENTGIITAPNGDILLAAGHEVQLVNSLDPNLRVNITAPAGDATNVGQLVASAGKLGLFGTVVRNSGTVSADSATLQGGKIVFKASQRVEAGGTISASGTSGGSVNISVAHSLDPNAPGVVIHTGNIQAQGAAGAGGVVGLSGDSLLSTAAINTDGSTGGGSISVQASNRALSTASAQYTANSSGGQGGDILVSANISNYTSGSYSATGMNGGSLTLAGNEIKLAGAQLDASGTNGGGNIHIGGVMRGAAGFGAQGFALTNATNVLANSGTRFKADALQTGNGGEVVLWSDQTMRFSGNISAKGGALGGDGGSAEVSGLTSLGYNGLTDLSAANGLNGTLLLDPRNITIVAGNSALAGVPYQEILDPTPGAGEGFGGVQNLELSNGNIVIASPQDSAFGANSGAVYFYTSSGTLLSALVGSAAGDNVGGNTFTSYGYTYNAGGLILLANGNVLVTSNNWNGTAGAVTWMNASGLLANGSAGGTVSSSNSLVGSAAGDKIGTLITGSYESSGVLELGNGNLVVVSNYWNNGGTAAAAGAVTWMNGATGKLSTAATGGVLSSANSLVGSTAGDKVGRMTLSSNYGVTPSTSDSSGISISGGNLIVTSNNWNNGGVAAGAGAVTWMNGATGALSDATFGGAVSAANSLVGSSAGDKVGTMTSMPWAGAAIETSGLVWLNNGNFLVRSGQWGSAGVANAGKGAVTWGSGTLGVSGIVSSANSIVGSTSGDRVGGGQVDAYTNDPGLVILPNSNYVVVSSQWGGGKGAVTWGNGSTGTSGIVSGTPITGNAPSLVGAGGGNFVGAQGISVQTGGSNYVVNSPWFDDLPNLLTDSGAATWMDGTSGALSNGAFGGVVDGSNSLLGGFAYDNAGGVTALNNGNFLAITPVWSGGSPTVGKGAVTWISGATGELSNSTVANRVYGGVIGTANSLVGSTGGDMSGSSIIQLVNGNILMKNPNWDNGTVLNAGALTWMNGATGKLANLTNGGPISAGNSLAGSAGGDMSGSSIVQLGNGNLLIQNQNWSAAMGAVTWMNGATGELSNSTVATPVYGGLIGTANSLVGVMAGDKAGLGNGTVLLDNGNVLIHSLYWNNTAGAMTWMNGATGVLADGTSGGAISAANSLLGNGIGDNLGSGGVTQLGNGKLAIASPYWSVAGAASYEGAVTWMDGATGKLSDGVSTGGTLTAANSLIGGTANDRVGSDGVTLITDNLTFWNYVVRSSGWSNGAVAGAGAITWVNGATGKTSDGSGLISAANSLVGSNAYDNIGFNGWSVNGVLVLGNLKLVFASSSWNGGRGAVSWMDGATGKLADGTQGGVVSATNSLVGNAAGDQIGSGGVTEVTDYSTFWNYTVLSPNWTNGTAAGAGAVTFGNGVIGTVGGVSGSNSLVGSAAGDQVGSGGITLVSDGATFWNYVVSSPAWGGAGGYLTGKGAVTWVNGMTGALSNGLSAGAVDSSNSLIGSVAGDQVGVAPFASWSSTLTGVNVFSNGNVLIRSQHWGGEFSALTWMNGATGALADAATGGVVSASNSLLGSAIGDDLGNGAVGVTELLVNGNWVITSPGWGGGGLSNGKGAATWMNSTTGQLADGSFGGVVSASNSLVGTVVGDIVGGDYWCDCTNPAGGITALSDGNYVVNSPDWSSRTGAVTWGNGATGLVGTVTSGNSLFGVVGTVVELASQPGKVLIGSGVANGGAGGVYLLSEQPSGPLFADNPSWNTFIGARWIAATLNAGTNVTLQANNDITQVTGAAITATGSGNLTLQAGRSVILEDVINITGALNLTANDPGAIAANRGTGAAVIDTTLATLTASQITRTNYGSATPTVTQPVAPTVSETGLQLEKLVNTIAMLPGTFIDIKPLVAPVVMNVTPVDTTSEQKKEAETAAAATAEAAALIATEAPVPQPMLQCR